MSVEPIDYLDLTRQALRGVMSNALSHAAEHGLVDEQHFFITFRTTHPGVVVPDWLNTQYPEEMTIVIQHEFWDLAVMADRFSVGLSFNNRSVTLVIPFASVRSFGDPSVNFQLDIPMVSEDGDDETDEAADLTEVDMTEDMPDGDRADEEATVVSLDAFRKK